MKVQRNHGPATLAGYEAALAFFAPCFAAGATAETLWVAHVDEKAQCLELVHYDGSRDFVAFPVRLIIADAIRLGAAGILLAHNHPSGDPTPSLADCAVTRKLTQASQTFGLTVVDHLVFGGEDCRSFRRMGLL